MGNTKLSVLNGAISSGNVNLLEKLFGETFLCRGQAVIETERLLLRAFTLQDVDAMAAIYSGPEKVASEGGPRPYGYAQHTIEETI